LFAAISIGDDRPDIPFTERFNQGAVFWSDSVSSSVSFPPHWERDSDAPDKYEHVLPDGPGKSQQLQAITPAIRQIIDGEAGGDKE
jgi:hypothetical protein